MPYLETDLTSDFSKFQRKNKRACEIAFTYNMEFKVKKMGKRLNFKGDFQPQQIPELLKGIHGCVYYKMSDMSRGAKPFDAMQTCYCPGLIGVLWYTPRKPKILLLLDVQEVDKLMLKGVKSITEKEAIEMAVYRFDLKTK